MSGNRTAQIFAWLDRVALDADLPPLSVRVALRLVRYINRETGCAWPSQERIAADLALTPRSVQKAVAALKGRGHLIVDEGRGRGRTNRYRLAAENANSRSHYREENTNSCSRHSPPKNTNSRSGEHPKKTNSGSPFGAKIRTTALEKDEQMFVQNHCNEPLKDRMGRKNTHHIPSVDGSDATDPNPASDNEPPGFADFIAVFPKRTKRQGRGNAAKAYLAAINRGHDQRAINAAARAYAAERQGQDPFYTKAMVNWLNEDRFLDLPSASGACAPTLDNETGDLIPARPDEQPIRRHNPGTRRQAENFAAWGVDPEDVWGITDEA